MSNAIAQSATVLAISSVSMEDFDFALSVQRIAKRQLPTNGLTVMSLSLGRSKLIAGVCNDFKGHYPSIFEKKDERGNRIAPERVDEKTYDKVCAAVDKHIETEFHKFISNPDDLVKTSSRFVHQAAKKDIIMRHTIQRDEVLALHVRKTGALAFVSETERQIAKYEKQMSVPSQITEDRLAKLRKRHAKEVETLAFIEQQIAAQKVVAAATP